MASRRVDMQMIHLAVYVGYFSLRMKSEARNVKLYMCFYAKESDDDITLFHASNMAGTSVANSCVIRGCSQCVSELVVNRMVHVHLFFTHEHDFCSPPAEACRHRSCLKPATKLPHPFQPVARYRPLMTILFQCVRQPVNGKLFAPRGPQQPHERTFG
jgi:hypothetical protein